jgi:hypothetical protein
MNPAGATGVPESTEVAATKQMLSAKAARFTESVIREMTRLAMRYGAVNLAQGFPDFPAPAEIKRAVPRGLQPDPHRAGHGLDPVLAPDPGSIYQGRR